MGVVLGTVRGLRRSRGFTQEQVSKKLGISFVAYNNKERGKVDFTSTEIGTLSKLFNVSPSRFYEEL